ncbi:hypothetical protein [Herpetosiphon giganteus]|uniref:hypothetical protein n=1 Tax=Herpetosiphon giganteus TaxID=2029754 RepID=UPI0019597391|nr:hypothetical protein [Herpetosiphon giganteus]MBM7841590.1 hypothetical protein [Herpetosiphon giganteus]
MPDLKWDVIDLIDALEVLPEEDDYQTHYRFSFERLGLTGTLDLWPLEATALVELQQTDSTNQIITFGLYIRQSIQLIRQGKNSLLCFHDCIITRNRFWMYDSAGNLSTAQLWQDPLNCYLQAKPTIHCWFGFEL